MMFSPDQIQAIPAFSWAPVEETPGIKAYLHSYRLDKAIDFPDIRHCFGNVQAGGFTLLLQAFIRPQNRASVFVLHGYTDHVGLYGHLIHVLLAAGYNVVALDLPGHGLSVSGERAGINGFQQYQQAVIPVMDMAMQALPGEWFLLGQSTGGAIAMDYIMNNPQHRFSKLVLLAPLVIPVRWPLVKAKLFALRRFLASVPRRFTRNSGDQQFLHFLRRRDPLQTRLIRTSWVQSLYDWQPHFTASPVSLTPTLLVQGEQDVVVDWRYNRQRIREKFLNLQEFILPQANHHLVNETEELRTQIFERLIRFMDATDE